MPPLRILTLNTWKNEGDIQHRILLMARGLRHLAPDVVLLQESFRLPDSSIHTAAQLADALGFDSAYARARVKLRRWQDTDVLSESGHAILARGRLRDCQRLVLPSSAAGGERIALLARLEFEDGRCVVAGCLHLSHLRGDHDGRRAQLTTILDHPWWREPADLRVLGGDANAELDSPALRWLGSHRDLELIAARGDGAPTSTHPLPPRPDRPGRSIDHLWTVTPRSESPPRITAAGIALDQPEPGTGLYPSDHAAVWADILTEEAP